MKIATKFEILRDVSPSSRVPCSSQPSSKPIRVAYLIDEDRFIASGGVLDHHQTVFLEDSMHAWLWKDGTFYYYGHAMSIYESGDIVVVFAEENVAKISASGGQA